MAEERPRLGRDVYIALSAVGWADGNLDQEEADAIVRTALEEGLDITEIAEIEAATKERIDLGVIDRKNLSKEDRLFVYGVACWLTRLDGVVSPAELQALKDLGEALKIPEKPRNIVDSIAQEVANQGDDRPSRYDLVALRRSIGDRLKSALAKKENDQ
ncbi:MAG: TerB family tellurite resistance protein [Myxococcales bacterium]|nr:MAG: TerB family tellurite resistance protein [Myxococcales bacterium]